jgi:hypothetical protein
VNKVTQEVVDKIAEEYNKKYILDRVEKYHYYIHGRANSICLLEDAINHFHANQIFFVPGIFDFYPDEYKNPQIKLYEGMKKLLEEYKEEIKAYTEEKG